MKVRSVTTRNPGTFPVVAIIVVLVALVLSFTVTSCGRHKREAKREILPAQSQTMDAQPAGELQPDGFRKGAESAVFGDHLRVWYRDQGDAFWIVTSSPKHVLLHLSALDSGPSNREIVYGVLPNGSVCAEYPRRNQAPAECGQVSSAVSVTPRGLGETENWWRVPKQELHESSGSLFLRLELFDDSTQRSDMYPQAPFSSIKLRYGPAAAVEVTQVTTQSKRLQVATNQPGKRSRPPSPPSGPSQGQPQSRPPLPRPQESTGCLHDCFAIRVSSLYTAIQNGGRYKLSDPLFAHGDNLVCSVSFFGVDPQHTSIELDWFVGDKPLAYSPPLDITTSNGELHRAYNNATFEAGKYTIVLKLNGRSVQEPNFTFTLEP